jgi:hypothetical protein
MGTAPTTNSTSPGSMGTAPTTNSTSPGSMGTAPTTNSTSPGSMGTAPTTNSTSPGSMGTAPTTNSTSPGSTTNSTSNPPILSISGSCNNINFQTQANTGSNIAGQQDSRNIDNQKIKQSQSNTQNACTTTIIENRVIKNFIHSNPIVQQQILQSPNKLIQIDTLQICNQIGDQACVSSNSKFKISFIQITKDVFGNWTLNGEVQNIDSLPHNQVRAILYLYDNQGNIIGLTQGYTLPSNLNSMQTATFNITEKQSDLMGMPKLYRVSFVFQN